MSETSPAPSDLEFPLSTCLVGSLRPANVFEDIQAAQLFCARGEEKARDFVREGLIDVLRKASTRLCEDLSELLKTCDAKAVA